MDLYETLGVDKDAGNDEIKKSYRKKAQESHPDRKGGDPELFQQIQLAYDTLGNPDKRKRYDETGSTQREPTIEEEAIRYLVSVFDHVLSLGTEAGDYVLQARQGLCAAISEEQRQLGVCRSTILQLNRKSGRLKVKSGDNLYQSLIESKLSALNEQITRQLKSIAILEKSSEMLENYEDTQGAVQRHSRYTIIDFSVGA